MPVLMDCLFSFRGRLDRQSFVLASLAGLSVQKALDYGGGDSLRLMVSAGEAQPGPAMTVYILASLAIAYSLIVLQAKRLRDIGYPGHWVVIGAFAIVALMAAIPPAAGIAALGALIFLIVAPTGFANRSSR